MSAVCALKINMLSQWWNASVAKSFVVLKQSLRKTEAIAMARCLMLVRLALLVFWIILISANRSIGVIMRRILRHGLPILPRRFRAMKTACRQLIRLAWLG